MTDSEYRRLLRSLLLPIDIKLESNCVSKLEEVLASVSGSEFADQLVWVEGHIEDWKDQGDPSNQIKDIIIDLIKAGSSEYGNKISEKYFESHKDLVDNHLLSFDLARSFLSHLLLIIRLTNEERMSSAQISNILGGMNTSVRPSRHAVVSILGKLRLSPKISVGNIESLFKSDLDFSTQAFGDLKISECIEKVSRIGESLGFQGELYTQVSILTSKPGNSKFTPYVQILHYQCSILEFFDHYVKDFYEFSPRGEAAKKLFEKYPSSISNAGNPFLNNAKSVSQISFTWAASKKNEEFPGALALFTILDGIDRMGFAARQEMALWIRGLIHRFIIESAPLYNPLPESISTQEYDLILRKVSEGNTKTKGILEQRLVDCLSLIIHSDLSLWKSRGIGDSVNASNMSKRKLGDCDFQDFTNKKVVAYEAHGGKLTRTYLEEHLRTLTKISRPRIEEWKAFSEPSEWTVTVKFVAHSFDNLQLNNIKIEGVSFDFELTTYKELIEFTKFEGRDQILNANFLEPLSRGNTPSHVRTKLLDWLELQELL